MGNRLGTAAVRAGAAVSAVTLVAVLAGCGLVAEQNARATSAGSGSGSGAVRQTTSSAPTPTPTPTPGAGPACPTLRCTSVLVTGDMLVHTQLWQQAREDAAAAGRPGLDFVPLLAGQRRYIRASDLAICHQETPVAGPDGPFSTYPSFNVPPQIITASTDSTPSTPGRWTCWMRQP